ncbi:MAG: sialate O-acetylesterase [Thermoguttaceae bacterium]
MRTTLIWFTGLVFGIVLLCSGADAAESGLKLAAPFTSNMVLPHGTSITLRGTANADEKVVVAFGDEELQTILQTTANQIGEWSVELPPQSPTSVPQKLVAKTSQQEMVLDNIVVGEVWLCAGQSNMLWRLNQCDNTSNALAFFDKPNSQRIRFLQMKPQNGWRAELPWRGVWEVGTTENAKTFSGVATFFAVARAEQYPNMPLGLIEVAYGGAPIESFLSRQKLLEIPELRDAAATGSPWCSQRAKDEIARAAKESTNQNGTPPEHMFSPNAIFRSALEMLTDLPLTGVLWYQGESNATTCGKPDEPISPAYCETGIRALIADLRKNFRSANAPREVAILMVQLPRCDRPWASFRDVQWRVAQDTPEVVTVVTTDTGLPNDVHPRDKKVVGERLAAAANRIINGDATDAIFPCADTATIAKDGEVIIAFTPLVEIQVAGDAKSGIELFADAEPIPVTNASLKTGANATTLSVQFDPSQKPTHVRYNWQNVPQGVLKSRRGLPVVPFERRLDTSSVLDQKR